MRFTANSFRNSAFSEPFLKRYRKQKLNFLSATHWLDEVGDYSGTQRPKYVLESDGSAVINSSHITSQTVTSKKGTATATVTTGQIAVGSGWISEIALSDGTVYFLEESTGTDFYDSSGAGNHATLTGRGTWAIKRDLTLINNANQNGYTKFSRFDGSAYIVVADGFEWSNEWSVEAEVTRTKNGSKTFWGSASNGNYAIQIGDDGIIRARANGTFFSTTNLIAENIFSKIKVTYTGGNTGDFKFYINDVLDSTHTNDASSVSQGFAINVGVNNNENQFFEGYVRKIISSNNSVNYYTADLFENVTGSGSSATNNSVVFPIIPRDESDITKDVLGNNLLFVGRVASDMKFVQSNRGEVGITSDYGQFNFDCTGVTVVSKEGQTTVNINQSNNRLIFTGIGNGSIYHIVLSNGLTFPIAEGSGVVSYAENDSTKTLTWFGNFDWSTQDTYHYNITQGFSVSGAVKLPYEIAGTVAGVNMLPYSEDFTEWSTPGVVDSLITDVFGVENNAQVFAAAGSAVTIRDIITIPESNTFYSISFFAKSIAGSGVLIIHGGVKRGATYIDFSFLNTFNFATKEFGNVGPDLTPRYEEMNNGWFKIVIEDYNGTDDNGVGTSFHAGFKISDGDSFALFGYQLENTATITAYQKTTGTATAGTFLHAYSNAATNGHNQAETKLKQVVFREDFGASSLHFDQSDLSSKVITYADIANTANVFVNQFPNVKINLETFFPSGIINQSNRQNNGLRRNKDTFFGNNK